LGAKLSIFLFRHFSRTSGMDDAHPGNDDHVSYSRPRVSCERRGEGPWFVTEDALADSNLGPVELGNLEALCSYG